MNSFTLRVKHAGILSAHPIFLLFCFCLPVVLTAQTSHSITGSIFDSKKAPLQGVSVTVKGTTKGTTTDPDGRFILPNVPAKAVLVISSTGFTSQELSVGTKAQFNVTLVEAVNALNDVVVVGYGTRQKRDVTGAVSQVKATQLKMRIRKVYRTC